MKTLNDLLARIPEMQAKAKQRAEQERHLHIKRGGVRVFKFADVAIRALHECSYVGPLAVAEEHQKAVGASGRTHRRKALDAVLNQMGTIWGQNAGSLKGCSTDTLGQNGDTDCPRSTNTALLACRQHKIKKPTKALCRKRFNGF